MNCHLVFGSVIFFIIHVAFVNSVCDVAVPTEDFQSDVYLKLYTGDTLNEFESYPIMDGVNLLSSLDYYKNTVIYIHGYNEDLNSKSAKNVLKALLSKKTSNVIALDWGSYSKGSSMLYMVTFYYGERVGAALTRTLGQMVVSGLSNERIHIIGHSIGAHIAGFVGKSDDFRIHRITGLDPANPVFYPVGCYLTPNDAHLVDVVYTDMGGHGSAIAMGSLNFYVNGGISPQPGCPPSKRSDLCSTLKSVEYFVESIYNPDKHNAYYCESFTDFATDSCEYNNTTPFGFNAQPVSSGSYFLDTS